MEKYSALKAENARMNEEIQRFRSEREGLKSRVDSILGKLEGI
jgi:FtsZ-binding cell division protein ZapB